jgi:hypothetical protein
MKKGIFLDFSIKIASKNRKNAQGAWVLTPGLFHLAKVVIFEFLEIFHFSAFSL